MVHDIEEQAGLDTVKIFWQRYRYPIVGVMLTVVIGFVLWGAWQYRAEKEAADASVLYVQFEKAWSKQDLPQAARVADDLLEHFPHTAHAQLAALQAAKLAFDQADYPRARKYLMWASKNGRSDELRSLANLRLATVLSVQKDDAAALRILEASPPPGFAALYAQKRGDILFAQGKTDEARRAYNYAREQTDPSAEQQLQILNLQLDLVGDSAAVS
jgi:predicted negative regulator of RcsB-dependent stress response